MLKQSVLIINGLTALSIVCITCALAQSSFAGEANDSAKRSESPQPALVTAIAFSPNGKVLAAAGFDRSPAEERVCQIATWNLRDGARTGSRVGHRKPVTAFCYSPDGTQLAVAADNKVHLWDVAAAELERTLEAGPGPVLAIGYSPSDRELVSVSGKLDEPSQVTWWDPTNGKRIHRIDGPAAGTWSASIRFSADGASLAIVFDGAVRIFDARTRDFVRSFDCEDNRLESADLSPDGKEVAIASGRKVSYFDARTGKLTSEWTLDADDLGVPESTGSRIMTVLFSPDGRRLAIAVDLGKRLPSGMVIFRELETGKCIRTVERVWGRMTRFAFSPDGKHLAYGRGDSIYLLASENGSEVAALDLSNGQ